MSNQKKKFLITTVIYYVNAKPHIGHAYTTVAGDILARFHREKDEKVFLLAGTDEHGLKIQQNAEKAGKEPQNFVDEISSEFKTLWDRLGIKYDNFIRTTDEKHKKAVQKVLQALFEKGVIYKGEYEGLYCVGCEQFKNENELVEGRCPDHDTVVEKLKEECYLLKMGEMQEELIRIIEKDDFAIQPEKYKKEILSFLQSEKLRDLSVSRKNVSWGIPLPFDAEHTTYVWFDAFLSYLTGLGWNGDLTPALSLSRRGRAPSSPLQGEERGEVFNRFWPADLQLIGKDILRVHATIWPIMLMHLGIEFPKQLFVHGHLLSGGRKMSKTIGNVISIDEMLEKFGVDGTRYLLLSAGTFGEDVDVTMERMIEKYNADLANGLGNLVSRVVKLNSNPNVKIQMSNKIPNPNVKIYNFIDKLELDGALGYIWKIIRENDKFVEMNKPWELVKSDENKFKEIMGKLISDLYFISDLIIPFMPETAEKIKKTLETKESVVLFPRIK
jgi:methionyl-tRNA synthetase